MPSDPEMKWWSPASHCPFLTKEIGFLKKQVQFYDIVIDAKGHLQYSKETHEDITLDSVMNNAYWNSLLCNLTNSFRLA